MIVILCLMVPLFVRDVLKDIVTPATIAESVIILTMDTRKQEKASSVWIAPINIPTMRKRKKPKPLNVISSR